jgi:hypothetical protein
MPLLAAAVSTKGQTCRGWQAASSTALASASAPARTFLCKLHPCRCQSDEGRAAFSVGGVGREIKAFVSVALILFALSLFADHHLHT